MSVRIDKRAALCTAKETSRYAISGALVAVGGAAKGGNPDAFAVATDGCCMSVVPLDAAGHDGPGFSGIAPIESLKVGTKIGMLDHFPGEKGKPGRFVTATYTDKRTGLAPAGMLTPAEGVEGVEGTFPPFADAFPQSGDYAAITLNPELLAKVVAAADAQDESDRGVTLLVPIMPGAVKVGASVTIRGGANKPAIVLGQTHRGGASVVMPIGKLDASELGDNYARALWMFQRAAELMKNPGAPSAVERLGAEKSDETPAEPTVVGKVGKVAKSKRAASPVPPASAAPAEPVAVPEPVPAVVLETPAPVLETVAAADPEPVAVLETAPEPVPVVPVARVEHVVGRETPPKGQATHKPGRWEVETGTSQKGRAWVALVPAERIDRAEYTRTLAKVLTVGGWAKNGGFAVWAEDRAKLAELIGN